MALADGGEGCAGNVGGGGRITMLISQVPRVLVVEDELMIVLMLEDILTEAGFEIAGVATKFEAALASVETCAFDAAILDANLAGVSSAPVAAALTARAIPFLVVSGYATTQQDGAFAAGLHVQKPFQTEALIQALRSILPANDAVEP